MLPIVNQPVEGARVSIYNEAVQAKFPLLGLRFKNTTGQDLMQGPVSVYEGGTYAGDGRIMDLQPNEERLLSFAIDQGIEVKAEARRCHGAAHRRQGGQGRHARDAQAARNEELLVKNRSPQDRDLIIEHPIRDDWKLVTPEKASEISRDVYRFDLKVAAGKTAKQDVVEERSRTNVAALAATDDQTDQSVPERQRGQRQVEGGAEQGARLQGRAGDDAARPGPGAEATQGDHGGPDAAAGQPGQCAAHLGGVQALPGEVRHAGDGDRKAAEEHRGQTGGGKDATGRLRGLSGGADRGIRIISGCTSAAETAVAHAEPRCARAVSAVFRLRTVRILN